MKIIKSLAIERDGKQWGDMSGWSFDIYSANDPNRNEHNIARVSVASIDKKHSIYRKFKGYIRYQKVINGDHYLKSSGQMSEFIDSGYRVFQFSGDEVTRCILKSNTSLVLNVIYKSSVSVSGMSYEVSLDDTLVINKSCNISDQVKRDIIDVYFISSGTAKLKIIADTNNTSETHSLDVKDALVLTQIKNPYNILVTPHLDKAVVHHVSIKL